MNWKDKLDGWLRSSGGGMYWFSLFGAFAMAVGVYVIALKLVTLVSHIIK